MEEADQTRLSALPDLVEPTNGSHDTSPEITSLKQRRIVQLIAIPLHTGKSNTSLILWA
jgi:hypothetical protein